MNIAGARRITRDEYDRKARRLKERQTEIAMRIGLLAAFCGGLAWAHNQEVFAAAFAVAAVVAGFAARPR